MIGKHRTTIKTDDNDFTIVKYHQTDVVKFDETSIILNTGGWTTNTTKNRMNQTSQKFDLGFSVFQKNWEWFLEYDGKTYLMYEKTIINQKTKSVYDFESKTSYKIN